MSGILKSSRILSTLQRDFHKSSPLQTMDLKKVVEKLEILAPTSLAESWDNVGLLIEPSAQKTVKTIFLTNDLTEPVLEEALDKSTDLIISYHPPLFRPLKRLTRKSWKERIAVKCVENRIAVFSPHTSWDAVPGGINSWLLAPYGPGTSQPVSESRSAVFPGNMSHSLTLQGVALDTEQLSPLLALPDINFNLDTTALTVSCAKKQLSSVIACLPAEIVEQVKITEHVLPPLPATGAGRVLSLQSHLDIRTVLEMTKKHLEMPYLRLALADGSSLESPVRSIGVCAGSGGSLLAGVKADIIITGEMSHHECLDFVSGGVSVILADHSNTERGYLKIVREKIMSLLDSQDINVVISSVDRDPLQIV